MKAIILDGSREGDALGWRVKQALVAQLVQSGWQVEHVLLREKKIGSCAGDFFCWTRSPGTCHVADDNRPIAEATMQSDLMIYLTPITFGGYSSHLKSLVDHQIQNISPFFTKVNAETHHELRYEKYPKFLAVGYMARPDERSEQIFRHLVWRNSINLYAPSSEAVVLYEEHSDTEMADLLQQGLLSMAEEGHSLRGIQLPASAMLAASHSLLSQEQVIGKEPAQTQKQERKAVLIVGSPRTKTSSSLALGSFLLEELEKKGFTIETYFTHTSVHSSPRMQALYQAVDAAHLVVFAFPLYVDSLPAPAIEVLEKIAVHRSKQSIRSSSVVGNTASETTARVGEGTLGSATSSAGGAARFMAIANCGFPESEHNATALAICAQFAMQAGLLPVGSLSLGGGEGLVHGRPLRDAHGPLTRVKKALAMAADALSKDQLVPQEVVDLLARPFIPAWLYRLVGSLGWKGQAKKYGMQKELRRQPYARP